MSDIAIVGMACRFPKAPSISHFWENLTRNIDTISTIPSMRFGFEHVDETLRIGGFVDDFDGFDATFFDIASREAAAMDPQQKLMLETTWHALEDANISPKTLSRTQTGVFIGVMSSDWGKITFSDPERIEVYHGIGNGHCMIANRISYTYNLKGPSLAIDTACSSSLVAVDVAARYLKTHDIDIAIVGGINLMLTPVLSTFYQKAGLASKRGRCQSFGHLADGMIRGEGAGIVVLKRATDAITAGDNIYAIIKGSAVNQDGLSNGITAPNRFAQTDVITRALRKANLAPADLQYVEAHGTGTLLGDPIEANALREAISQFKKEPLHIGSVKSHIGHLEGAAGIAGLIKTALSIHHKTLLPNLHFGSGNTLIDFEKSKLNVLTKLLPWDDEIRRAGVSSFGLGGTNAHIILESALNSHKSKQKIPLHVFHRSARESIDIIPISSYSTVANTSLKINKEKLAVHQIILTKAANIGEIAIEKIDINADISQELGFDSMMIVDFKSEIEKELGLQGKLELKDIVTLSTIAQFIEHVCTLLEEDENHA